MNNNNKPESLDSIACRILSRTHNPIPIVEFAKRVSDERGKPTSRSTLIAYATDTSGRFKFSQVAVLFSDEDESIVHIEKASGVKLPKREVKKGKYKALPSPKGKKHRKARAKAQAKAQQSAPPIDEHETFADVDDTELQEKIADRFVAVGAAAMSVLAGRFNGALITGAPGVGKTYHVKKAIMNMAAKQKRHVEVISGRCTPIRAFCAMYEFSKPGDLLLFDDTDTLLEDSDALNVLKVALSSEEKREVSWNTSSNVLSRDDIPRKFEYEGGIICISNMDFKCRAKKLDKHLAALRSRCLVLDVGCWTVREKMLRIYSVADTILKNLGVSTKHRNEAIEWLETNKEKIEDLDLRAVEKFGKIMEMVWSKPGATPAEIEVAQKLAEMTLFDAKHLV